MAGFHDTMRNGYKVFFHQGQELGLKTRVSRGTALVDSSGLNIKGPGGNIFVPARDIIEVELFRLHGTGRVVRVDHQGGRLYLSVTRLMIGQFAFINFFKTGELHKLLAGLVPSN
jgi:hypothetical protein